MSPDPPATAPLPAIPANRVCSHCGLPDFAHPRPGCPRSGGRRGDRTQLEARTRDRHGNTVPFADQPGQMMRADRGTIARTGAAPAPAKRKPKAVPKQPWRKAVRGERAP